MSGGSASGTISYPVYIQNTHQAWMLGDGVYDARIPAGEDITSLMVAAIGNSPYAGETAFDPNASLSLNTGSPLKQMQDRYTTVETAIDALAHSTDWAAMLAAAVSKVDDVDGVGGKAFPAIAYPGAAFSTGSTPPAEGTFTGTLKLSEAITAVATAALGRAKDAMLDGTSGALTTLDNAAIGSLVSNAEDAAIAKVDTAMATIFSNAIAEAQAAADSAYVQAVVDAYEARLNRRYNRSINNFVAGMADIGAVNTTSFMMGLVAIETEKQDDISAYDAQLSQGTFDKLVQVYIATFADSYSRYIGEYVRTGLATLETQARAYLTVFMGYLENEVRSKLTYLTNTAQYQTAYLSEEARHRVMENAAKTQLAIAPAEMRARAVVGGVSEMLQAQLGKVQTQMTSVQMQTEINRLKIVSLQEQKDRDVELDHLDGIWDLEVYKYGGGVMAAISGAQPLPKGPSRLQSAIGGAMTGAALGAKVTSHPAGAIAGGVIGGLGGLFG